MQIAQGTADEGYMGGSKWSGGKATREFRRAADIAKDIRADLKEAQKDGDLPGKADGFVYRVRSESFAGGQAVRINVVGPGDTEWAFRETRPQDRAWGWNDTTWTDEALRIGALVQKIANQYVRSDTNSMVDYFNVSCYMNVHCGSHGLCLPGYGRA